MKDCIFCKILSGEIPSYKIYEDDKTYAFLDIANDCYGHTVVIPKKHCTNVLDCDEADFLAVMATVQKISRHFVDDLGFDGVNILNASGKAAQQSVFHLHMHIIPRKNNDGLNTWALNDKFDFDLAEICNHLQM